MAQKYLNPFLLIDEALNLNFWVSFNDFEAMSVTGQCDFKTEVMGTCSKLQECFTVHVVIKKAFRFSLREVSISLVEVLLSIIGHLYISQNDFRRIYHAP